MRLSRISARSGCLARCSRRKKETCNHDRRFTAAIEPSSRIHEHAVVQAHDGAHHALHRLGLFHPESAEHQTRPVEGPVDAVDDAISCR